MKILVAGGSTASVVRSAAFRTTGGAVVLPSHEGFNRPVIRVSDVVEGGHVEPALAHETTQHVAAIGGLRKACTRGGMKSFAFAGRDDVGEECERLGITKVTAPPIITIGS